MLAGGLNIRKVSDKSVLSDTYQIRAKCLFLPKWQVFRVFWQLLSVRMFRAGHLPRGRYKSEYLRRTLG